MSKKKLKLKELEVESFVTDEEKPQQLKGGDGDGPGTTILITTGIYCSLTPTCPPHSWPCGGGSAGMCSPDTPDSWGTCAY